MASPVVSLTCTAVFHGGNLQGFTFLKYRAHNIAKESLLHSEQSAQVIPNAFGKRKLNSITKAGYKKYL